MSNLIDSERRTFSIDAERIGGNWRITVTRDEEVQVLDIMINRLDRRTPEEFIADLKIAFWPESNAADNAHEFKRRKLQ